MPLPIRRSLRLFAAAALALGAATAAAADPVTIAASIPYADQVGSADIRNDCRWNSTLPLILASRSNGGIVTTTADLATVPGKKLFVTATEIKAVSGGSASGPKRIALAGQLVDDGKVVGTFEFKRSVTGQTSVCATLSQLGLALADDIEAWLKNPTMAAAPAAKPAGG